MDHLRSLRWNHDKTFTMKSWQNIYVHVWQNIYEEVMKIQWGEKRGEKRGEISPLHLNIIFGSFTLITMKKFRQIIYTHYDEEVLTNHKRRNHDKTCTKKFRQNIYVHVWQNIYDEEIMKIHEVRKEVRKEVRSNMLT